MSNPINPEDYKAPDFFEYLESAGFAVAPAEATDTVNLPYQKRMLELVERLQRGETVLFHQARRNGKTNLVNKLFKELEHWKPVEPNESKTRYDNESLIGDKIDELQYVWLEYYSIIELYDSVEEKWCQNKAHPFIHPDNNSIDELHSDVFRYTDPKFFSYWDERKRHSINENDSNN